MDLSLSENAIQALVKFAEETSAKLVAISVADPHVPIAPIVGGISLDRDFMMKISVENLQNNLRKCSLCL